MIRIEILYFAAARDIVGQRSEQVDVPDAIQDIAGLAQWLSARYPLLEPYWACIRFAQNEQFVSLEARLRHNDIIAVIPPVAGG